MYAFLRILKIEMSNLYFVLNRYHPPTYMYLTGDGEIIHLTCDRSGCDGLIGIFKRFLSKSVVKCAKLEDVVGDCDVIVNNFLDGKVK